MQSSRRVLWMLLSQYVLMNIRVINGVNPGCHLLQRLFAVLYPLRCRGSRERLLSTFPEVNTMVVLTFGEKTETRRGRE